MRRGSRKPPHISSSHKLIEIALGERKKCRNLIALRERLEDMREYLTNLASFGGVDWVIEQLSATDPLGAPRGWPPSALAQIRKAARR